MAISLSVTALSIVAKEAPRARRVNHFLENAMRSESSCSQGAKLSASER